MNDLDRLKALKSIADLLRERDLAALSRAQAAKERTEDLLAALDHSTNFKVPQTPAAATVVEKYGLWATNRRTALNQQYARDMVLILATRETAKRAFGTVEVISRLIARK